MTDIKNLNRKFKNLSPQKRLKHSIKEFDNIAVASSFGLEDAAILNIIYKEIGEKIPVIFLDTLYHFEETLNLVYRFKEKYDLKLEIYRPPEGSKEEFEKKHGKRLWEKNIEKYHELTKLRQIRKALKNRDSWITGIRREQSETRADANMVEWDEKHKLVKINPIVDWKRETLEEYIKENNIPYNPLHDEGYLSIGDEPLTDPIKEGEKERAGRWRNMNKKECGLHE